MYLEISPRCSGKTTRLKEAMLTKILEGEYCIGVFIHMSVAKEVERWLHNRLPAHLVNYRCVSCSVTQNINFNAGEHRHNIHWFYDEFDLMDYVRIRPTGYYVGTLTTPINDKSIADHVLGNTAPKPGIELYIRNKGQYNTHAPKKGLEC